MWILCEKNIDEMKLYQLENIRSYSCYYGWFSCCDSLRVTLRTILWCWKFHDRNWKKLIGWKIILKILEFFHVWYFCGKIYFTHQVQKPPLFDTVDLNDVDILRTWRQGRNQNFLGEGVVIFYEMNKQI